MLQRRSAYRTPMASLQVDVPVRVGTQIGHLTMNDLTFHGAGLLSGLTWLPFVGQTVEIDMENVGFNHPMPIQAMIRRVEIGSMATLIGVQFIAPEGLAIALTDRRDLWPLFNRRGNLRARLLQTVEVEPFGGRLVDVGSGGIAVDVPNTARWTVGMREIARFCLPNQMRPIDMAAEVIRVQPKPEGRKRIGMRFLRTTRNFAQQQALILEYIADQGLLKAVRLGDSNLTYAVQPIGRAHRNK